jgi:hypothetical protein
MKMKPLALITSHQISLLAAKKFNRVQAKFLLEFWQLEYEFLKKLLSWKEFDDLNFLVKRVKLVNFEQIPD